MLPSRSWAKFSPIPVMAGIRMERARMAEWDVREPERVEMFIGPDGQETIVAKVNWEVEYEMNMSEIFAPMTMERIEQMVARWEAVPSRAL